MSISERMLKKWRGEALIEVNDSEPIPTEVKNINLILSRYIEINTRILSLTQELLDQHLLRKVKK